MNERNAAYVSFSHLLNIDCMCLCHCRDILMMKQYLLDVDTFAITVSFHQC